MNGIDDLLGDATRRMDKSVESTQVEFNTVRTGRASAALLDRINGRAGDLQQTVKCPGIDVPGDVLGAATGRAKMDAEQEAARQALARL